MKENYKKNANSIIKRISEQSIHNNKSRNAFTIITVALAAALLMSILLWFFGTRQEDINLVKDTAQIVYRGLSKLQGDILYEQEEIEWVGENIAGPVERIDDTTVNFSYGNAEVLKSQQIEFKGKIPKKKNEIMLSSQFLEKLGYDDELNQKLIITFEDGSRHEFILTGIWASAYEVKGTYLALVSKEYLDKVAGYDLPMDYYISLKNAPEMTEEEATEYADTLASKLNISDDQIIIRSDYFMQLEDTDMGVEMFFFALVGILTLLGAGIVIYSIFYISIAGNIRNYGQLRTIGTTKKQVKKIVYREGKLLAIVGIPLGLIIGNIIGYFLIPDGWMLNITVLITIGTGLFTGLILVISIYAPIKRASNVSPIEAVRYSVYRGSKKVTGKLYRKLTPFSLAKMNLSRNKIKSILAILSLSIGGILLVTISSVLISHNSEAETRGNSFPVGEFNINLNANQSFETANVSLTGLQKKNFFDDNFVEQIKSIDGVKDIKRWYYTDAEYRVNQGEDSWIQGFSKEEQPNLEQNLIAGTANYDELVGGNGIVLLEDRMKKAYEMEAALGDSVEVNYQNVEGEIVTKTYRIMGIVSSYNYVGFNKCFSIPEQLMREATGLDYTGSISVIIDKEKYKSVESDLRELLSGNSYFTLDTFEEEMNSLSSMYQYTFGVMLIVAIVITCFSLINLVNTTITNFLSRKQEFAILQSIGLTQKQLIKMLQYEGMTYSLSATLLTMVLGTGIGYISVNLLKEANPYFFFTFPWQVVIAYFLSILILQIVVSVFMTGTLKKESLVDQIRVIE